MVEQSQQIVVLAVDVADDLDRRLNLDEGGLLGADHLRLCDQALELLDGHVDLRARLLCGATGAAGDRVSGGSRGQGRTEGERALSRAARSLLIMLSTLSVPMARHTVGRHALERLGRQPA